MTYDLSRMSELSSKQQQQIKELEQEKRKLEWFEKNTGELEREEQGSLKQFEESKSRIQAQVQALVSLMRVSSQIIDVII